MLEVRSCWASKLSHQEQSAKLSHGCQYTLYSNEDTYKMCIGWVGLLSRWHRSEVSWELLQTVKQRNHSYCTYLLTTVASTLPTRMPLMICWCVVCWWLVVGRCKKSERDAELTAHISGKATQQQLQCSPRRYSNAYSTNETVQEGMLTLCALVTEQCRPQSKRRSSRDHRMKICGNL